ncbi:hypothetical protein ID866_2693 [Astraeus odoratus]|nr:hypothetical protein ID866_2693 [Astraeus odoratus]
MTTTTMISTHALPATSTTPTFPTSPRPSLSVDTANPRPSTSSLTPDTGHPPTRRVSSESQRANHGRTSPSLRSSSRRTPVPVLLDSFPVPPSHIPLSPATPFTPPLSAASSPGPGSATVPATGPLSPIMPPPTAPPTAPLPPVPGRSSVVLSRPSFQSTRSASPVSVHSASGSGENAPRGSMDTALGQAPMRAHERGRPRRGSLSTLRNAVYFPSPDDLRHVRSDSIPEEPAIEGERGSAGAFFHTSFPLLLTCILLPAPAPPAAALVQSPTLPMVSSPQPPSALDATVGAAQSAGEGARPLDTTLTMVPPILRPGMPRKTSTGPPIPSSDVGFGEDSITSIDLNALKSDNECDGEGDDPRTLPDIPPAPQFAHSHPTASGEVKPLYTHTPRKPSRSSISSTHAFPTCSTATHHHVVNDNHGHYGAHNDCNVSNTIVSSHSPLRSTSPEISQIISLTPRPRKRSSTSRSRSRTSNGGRERRGNTMSTKASDAIPPPPVPKLSPTRMRVAEWGRSALGRESHDETECVVVDGNDTHDSDSSIDLHTPLPHLMLRHGMLSPNSKLLPRADDATVRMSIVSDVSQLSSVSYFSNASNVSLMSNASTSSKHLKDARDTPRRRTRHRDGKLLKGGIGLTTGLGWSDRWVEDEDAPSALTRRLSQIVLNRSVSSTSIRSSRSSHSQPCSYPLARSISHSVLREIDEYEGVGANGGSLTTSSTPADEFGYANGVSSRSLPLRRGSRASGAAISRSGSTTSGSGSRYSNYSTMSAPAAGLRTRTNSGSSFYEPVSRTNSFPHHNSHGLALSIPEQDDGVTPTRAAFDQAASGAPRRVGIDGTQGVDFPHTPSSTDSSSASIPFPATPESTQGIVHSQLLDKHTKEGEGVGNISKAVLNKDKTLPPLPPSIARATSTPTATTGIPARGTFAKGKYPHGLGLKAPSGIERPRTYSNASSVSTNSALVAPSANGKDAKSASTGGSTSRGPSPAPGHVPPTRTNGRVTPRPSLAIPRASTSSVSSAPRRPSTSSTSPRPSMSSTSPRPSLSSTSPRPSLTLSSSKLPTSVPASTPATPNQGSLPRPLKLIPPKSATVPSPTPISPTESSGCQSPFLSRTLSPSITKALQPGEQLPRPGQVLTYNRNVHDQLKLRSLSTSSGIPSAKVGPVSPGGTQTLLLASQGSNGDVSPGPGSSPLPSSGPGDSPKPRPRTGTGMAYRTNGTSRIRVPSTPLR